MAFASEAPFDVILMDLKLPDGDGCAFVRGLRPRPEADAHASSRSVHALAVDQQRALDVGCSAFIEPIDVATFVDRIARLQPDEGDAAASGAVKSRLAFFTKRGDPQEIASIGQRLLW